MSNDIQSGFFQTTTNTPTGNPKQIAVDNPYVSKAEFIQSFEAIAAGIDATSPVYTNGWLDKMLISASGAVNRYCARYFDTQTIDETKTSFWVRPYNPQLTTIILSNRPYQAI